MNKDRRARQKARKLLSAEAPERHDVTVTAGTASAFGVTPQPPDTSEHPDVTAASASGVVPQLPDSED